MTKITIASLAASLSLGVLPAWSAVEYFEVQTAPPAPQVEIVPAPVEGQVWIPGYYDYRDNQYVWVQGHFEPARKGYVYTAPRYVEREHRYYAGRWATDEEEHGGFRNKLRAKKQKLHEKITGRRDDD